MVNKGAASALDPSNLMDKRNPAKSNNAVFVSLDTQKQADPILLRYILCAVPQET